MPAVHVWGAVVDDHTRCAHWHSALDVVAMQFACCGRFYPCRECHDDDADHATKRWPAADRDERAVLCGVCRTRMTIADYLTADDTCAHCGAAFNPGCRTHRHLYFD